ncbi:MAG: 1-acyl-sn-glycerol-3-phosphate acyltransferase [Clostridiales bacterium]|nr:1-acyl-sn-glycerol-3-phosphate acyltransferase [Clostridiales bacterium]
MEKSQDRLDVLEKIAQYEREGKWDIDVENDPETIELLPDKVDYLNKKFKNKIATKIANIAATRFFEKMLKNGQMIIKEIRGIENYLSVDSGAMITCNHFNACDNYAVWRAIKPYMGKKRLYKVIREGNFTNFPNPIGFFFRHCNTLPLSSNSETMKKFMVGVNTLLKRGEKILIYPEQAMWWNYKKPRPFKNGAFRFAVSCNVPVIPVFITMEDSENMEPNGFPVQAYTVHFLEPIYPKQELSKKENIEYMKDENYKRWVKTYEDFYGEKLAYNTAQKL